MRIDIIEDKPIATKGVQSFKPGTLVRPIDSNDSDNDTFLVVYDLNDHTNKLVCLNIDNISITSGQYRGSQFHIDFTFIKVGFLSFRE